MRLTPLARFVPFAVCLVLLLTNRPSDEKAALPDKRAPGEVRRQGRLVVLCVDSLPREVRREKPNLMPELTALSKRPDARWVDVHTCSGNFTLPCLQTMLEGRESPFASGMHNYTGAAGAAASLPGIASAAGYGTVLISDHTLPSLYGTFARKSVDVTNWAAGSLDRDLRAIDVAMKVLDDPENRLLVLHTVGSDHVTHRYFPGTPGYKRHFGAVSRRLARFWSKLDFERDTIVITGDHGHQAQGHHTRESTILFVGKRFTEILDAQAQKLALIEQRDMLYLLAYPQLLPLPPGYEGRYFLAAPERAPERVKRFQALQRRELARRGYSGDLAQQARQVALEQTHTHIDSLWTHLPAVLCYVCWLLWWPALSGWRSRLLLTAGLAAGATALLALGSPARGPWLSLLPLAVCAAALARGGRRREQLWLLVVLGLAALLSYIAKDWSVFFHTRGGFRWTIPVFFATLLAAGAGLAWLRWGRLSLLPVGAATFATFCLPGGPYYYLGGTNMVQSYLWTAALLGLIWLLARPARITAGWRTLREQRLLIPAALLAVMAPLLFMQDAGGWSWRPLVVEFLKALGPTGTVLIYYALGALLTAWLPRVAPRLVFAGLWIGCHAYCVGVTWTPLENYVGAYAPHVVLMTWLPLRTVLGARSDAPSADEEAFRPRDLVFLAGVFTAMYFEFGGFAINRIEYAFGMEMFSWVEKEHNLFLGIVVTATLKYGLPCFLTILLLLFKLGAPAMERLFKGLFYLFQLKIAALLIQLLVGALGTGEKLYELAVADLLFIFMFIALFAIIYTLLWLAHKARRGRHPAPQTSTS